MIIEVNNLIKTYQTYERGSSFKEAFISLFHRKVKEVDALKGIGFSMEQGELTALLGPNGAGKSTILKILTSILYPTSGEVKVLGYVPWKDRIRYVSNIGAVFGQKSQLIWDIPPEDAFQMNRAIYDIPAPRFKENRDRLVKLLDVSHVINKPTRQLSLGERMKCEFIMAMLHSPKVVFLDEPTIGLDVVAKDTIRDFILDRNKDGTTFILTTHDLGDVEHLARRVVVVNQGEIVFDDSLKGLIRHIGDRRTICLTTKEPIILEEHAGVLLKEKSSPYEAHLELDVAKLGLDAFLKKISEKNIIADLSVQEIPIEEVIKELYKK